MGPSEGSREACLRKTLADVVDDGGRTNVGTGGTERGMPEGTLDSRGLRLGLGPKVAPEGWGVIPTE